MVSIHDIIRQLASNADAIRALVETVPDEQAQWKPGADAWSLTEVMSHVYNEERGHFRTHLKEMLADPPKSWGSLGVQGFPVADHRQALADFLKERQASIAWLQTFGTPDWGYTVQIQFGPTDTMAVSSGDVLVSWVEHDYLHIRQINELLHGWNAKEAAPNSVDYAGGW